MTDHIDMRTIKADALAGEPKSDLKLRPSCWTAREALACAYCWTEFANAEERQDTPETYWLSITERARNDCRSIANKKLLLAVARGHAVAVPPVAGLQEGQFAALKEALGIKADNRVRKVLNAVVSTFKRGAA
ncbi:hypothetical protein [Rhodopila sp.]|uniref:hypothetical protein n=1 Tax=Rhodopila sp. TaxID=2480087 RepID=UPI003D0F4253